MGKRKSKITIVAIIVCGFLTGQHCTEILRWFHKNIRGMEVLVPEDVYGNFRVWIDSREHAGDTERIDRLAIEVEHRPVVVASAKQGEIVERFTVLDRADWGVCHAKFYTDEISLALLTNLETGGLRTKYMLGFEELSRTRYLNFEKAEDGNINILSEYVDFNVDGQMDMQRLYGSNKDVLGISVFLNGRWFDVDASKSGVILKEGQRDVHLKFDRERGWIESPHQK